MNFWIDVQLEGLLDNSGPNGDYFEKTLIKFSDDVNPTIVNATVSEENVTRDDSFTLLSDLRKLPKCNSLEENCKTERIDGDNDLESEILTDEEIINVFNKVKRMKMRWR